MQKENLCSPTVACSILGVSKQTMYNWIDQDRVRVVKYPGVILVDISVPIKPPKKAGRPPGAKNKPKTQ